MTFSVCIMVFGNYPCEPRSVRDDRI